MSVNNQDSQRPPEEGVATATLPGGLQVSDTAADTVADTLTLAALPIGARLVMRCRKDWRAATVSVRTPETVTLSVSSPSGHTYRVRRPPDTQLSADGGILVLGEGCWRAAIARYDQRW